MIAWLAYANMANSFSPSGLIGQQHSMEIYNPGQCLLRVSPLRVLSSTEILGEHTTSESPMDDGDDDDESDELILEFIDMVQTTEPGFLDVDDVDILREIMDKYTSNGIVIEGVEPAQVLENLLYRLIAEWQASIEAGDEDKEAAYCPSAKDFDIVLSAWKDSDNEDNVFRVLSILSDQRELVLAGNPSVQPTLSSIQTVLKTLARSRERGIDKRAMQVFESIGEFGLEPDADLYSTIVTIVAKSRAPGAPERAEKLVKEGVKQHPPQIIDGKFAGIGVDAFNAIVVAYAKSRKENGPQRAQSLIAYMDQVDADSGNLGICSPNTKTFTSLIDAYCQQNDWDSVSQADQMFNRLLDQFLEGNEDLEPSVATWTIVINAWGRLSKKNRRGAADRAGRLLRRMEDLSREGRISAKPDVITYVTCMNAFAFARGGEDAGEAEKLLEEMNELYMDGDGTMKPSARSIKVVADAWIKQRDMESAEQLLDDYEHFLFAEDEEKQTQNAKDLFQSMLLGYAQQDNMDRARSYLDYMLEKGVTPDNLCFERLIETYTRIDDDSSLKMSLEVFELVEKHRKEGSIDPNERVYNTFIRAITKYRVPQMHKKAELLLKRMKKLYEDGNDSIEPTIFTYNTILNTCSESVHVEGSDQDDAFKTAVRVFSALKSSNEDADPVTFGNLLRCSQLLPEGDKKEKFISATFRLCAEQGYVNALVLRDLQIVAQEDLWRSILGVTQGEPDIEMLPSEWSYRVNIPKQRSNEGRRPRRGGRKEWQ